MNPEVKAKWVAALRSGQYKQGRGVLRHGKDEYCCLGVLCDLHSKETGQPWGDLFPTTDGGYYHYEQAPAIPPRSVRDWAAIEANPTILGANLTEHNDHAPYKSFPEIADLIETHL